MDALQKQRQEESAMMKAATFIVDKRNLFFLLLIIGLIFSAFSSSWVQVENSLTEYLPADSETRQGLDIMAEQFITYGTASIMVENVSLSRASELHEQLCDIEGVQSVAYTEEDNYNNVSALYAITFDYSETDDRCLDAQTQMKAAKAQLQGESCNRVLIYLNLPEGGEETYAFLDTIRSLARKYYPEGNVYVVGNSSVKQDFKISFATDNLVITIVSILIVLVVLLFTFKSAGMPLLLILVIQGAIWINFSIPAFTGTSLFFMSYLVVSSIQMGANIDYAIVIASRHQELKNEMHHRDAIIETMNFAFHTIITSGTILACAGILIGMMTSEAAIVGIGQSIGRGTIISIALVMFVLPQILLVGGEIVDKTSFSMPKANLPKIAGNGHVRVDGLVRGEIHGYVSGIIRADINGDVDLNLLSGKTAEEGGAQDEA